MGDVHPILVADRLTLRRFVPTDVDNLLTLDGDPQVMRFLDRKTRSRAEIEAAVLPRFLSYYERHRDFGVWAAETRAESRFVGWFSLRPVTRSDGPIVHWSKWVDQTSIVEIGYRLRRDAWGHGYATEVTRALVCHAFNHLNVEEIVATTMTVNAASRRVMEKAGLQYRRLSFPTGRTRSRAPDSGRSSTDCAEMTGPVPDGIGTARPCRTLGCRGWASCPPRSRRDGLSRASGAGSCRRSPHRAACLSSRPRASLADPGG